VIETLFAWGAVVVAFLIGVAWNADAYCRGYRDGYSAGSVAVKEGWHES
jgi:hypothetical protein